jgi:hypothetical protein
VRALRAIVLFGVALALAWVAGWALRGTEISGPAGVAAFAALAMAITPAPMRPADAEPAQGKGKGKGKSKKK